MQIIFSSGKNKMKKNILLIIAALCSFLTFADVEKYKVKSVSGTVKYEDGKEMKDVKKGMELSPGTKISVGVGSVLVLNNGKKDIRIKALSKGTVGSFDDKKSAKIKAADKAEQNSVAKAKDAGTEGMTTISIRSEDMDDEDFEFITTEESSSK